MGYTERRREAAERMAGYYAEAADYALAGHVGSAVIAGRMAERMWDEFLGRKENSIAAVNAERTAEIRFKEPVDAFPAGCCCGRNNCKCHSK